MSGLQILGVPVSKSGEGSFPRKTVDKVITAQSGFSLLHYFYPKLLGNPKLLSIIRSQKVRI